GLGRYAQVKTYDPNAPPWREINAADISIYHIGNHAAFHGAIWQVSRQHPGVIVLHDLKLQDFFLGLVAQGRLAQHEYLAMMEHYYPKVGSRLAASYWAQVTPIENLREVCPLTGAASENALGIATHSSEGGKIPGSENQCPV